MSADRLGFAEDAAHLAHCEPEYPADPLAGFLKEAILRWSGSPPQTLLEMRKLFCTLIDVGMTEAEQSGYENAEAKETLAAIGDLLFLLKDVSSPRIHIYALLLLLGKIREPEAELARKLGVTKAQISKVKIQVQDFYNLPCRVGRSEEARAKFSHVGLSRRLPKRNGTNWVGLIAWNAPCLS